jgi:peptidoglycan/LPS O-acetylase OafA/YrhL
MFLPVFGDEGPALLWGGFVAIALGVVAIQHAVTRPPWLEGRVLVWLGQISYGLYLWHYVFVRTDSIPTWVALPLTVVAAAASWYFVEEPVRRLRERFDDRRPRRNPDVGAENGQATGTAVAEGPSSPRFEDVVSGRRSRRAAKRR